MPRISEPKPGHDSEPCFLFYFFSSSIHNTLYLDVVCPSVKPELIVINQAAAKGSASGAANSDSPVNQKHSTKGTPTKAPAGSPAVVAVSQAAVAGVSQDNVVDFGKVSIGHKAIRTIGVKNTSSQTVNVTNHAFLSLERSSLFFSYLAHVSSFFF